MTDAIGTPKDFRPEHAPLDAETLRARFAEGLRLICEDMIRSIRIEPSDDADGLTIQYGDRTRTLSMASLKEMAGYRPFSLACEIADYGHSAPGLPHRARYERKLLTDVLGGPPIRDKELGQEFIAEVKKYIPYIEEVGCFYLTPGMDQVWSEILWREVKRRIR